MRTCRDGCQPAYCQSGSGRSEPSFGRRKREINNTLDFEANNTISDESNEISSELNNTSVIFLQSTTTSEPIKISSSDKTSKDADEDEDDEEYVREMIEVSILVKIAIRNRPEQCSKHSLRYTEWPNIT